jgi:hypothetical protein
VRLPAGHPALAPGTAPRWRRLDCKVYSRPSLPTAICYFTGDSSFNRALRYWAKASKPAGEAARLWCAQKQWRGGAAAATAATAAKATGWHLSDTHMFPIDVSVDKAATRVPAGPSLDLTCETDLFEALGLAYVPPFCRTFTVRKSKDTGGGGPAAPGF